MFKQYLDKARSFGVADEEAYARGYHDACDALRSDDVYYNVANAKQGHAEAIRAAADYVEAGAQNRKAA